MNDTMQQLFLAEQKAKDLFHAIEARGLIVPGKTEQQLADEIVQVAKTDFGAENHWGKKIVRTGINTLQPYSADHLMLELHFVDRINNIGAFYEQLLTASVS